jgi:carbon-monoxide dehydrogenase medium subunit
MKPVAFDLIRQSTVDEALKAARDAQGAGKFLAGGQSIGPMLNLRLVQPRLLIDIAGIEELVRVDEKPDSLTLGACITTSNIEDRRIPTESLSMLPHVASGIAYRAVRNRGTIGGSVCHSDPAADWISTLCTLDADCVLAGNNGKRNLRLAEFCQGAFQTALDTDEMLVALTIPKVSKQARWGYSKLCRKVGEFAMAIGGILIDPERDVFRLVVGATNGRPIVIDNAQEIFGTSSACGRDGAFDESALLRRLDTAGLLDRHARRHYIAVVKRAAAQVRAC